MTSKLVQHIACFLVDDADLSSFTSVCTSVAYQVLPSHSSIWRRRFEDQYDLPRGHNSAEIKIEYQTRAIVLAQKISFRYGEKEEQELWLELIKTLHLESYRSRTISDPRPSHSKNRGSSKFSAIPISYTGRLTDTVSAHRTLPRTVSVLSSW